MSAIASASVSSTISSCPSLSRTTASQINSSASGWVSSCLASSMTASASLQFSAKRQLSYRRNRFGRYDGIGIDGNEFEQSPNHRHEQRCGTECHAHLPHEMAAVGRHHLVEPPPHSLRWRTALSQLPQTASTVKNSHNAPSIASQLSLQTQPSGVLRPQVQSARLQLGKAFFYAVQEHEESFGIISTQLENCALCLVQFVSQNGCETLPFFPHRICHEPPSRTLVALSLAYHHFRNNPMFVPPVMFVRQARGQGRQLVFVAYLAETSRRRGRRPRPAANAAAIRLWPECRRRSPFPVRYLVILVDDENVGLHGAVMAVQIGCVDMNDLLGGQVADDNRRARFRVCAAVTGRCCPTPASTFQSVSAPAGAAARLRRLRHR